MPPSSFSLPLVAYGNGDDGQVYLEKKERVVDERFRVNEQDADAPVNL
jgi:hypothetical protein